MLRDKRGNVHYSYGCCGGTRLPPLDLVVQGQARAAAHQLWILGCWSYLHPQLRAQQYIDAASEDGSCI